MQTEIKSFAKQPFGAIVKSVEDVQVLHAMKRHGGGFAEALAEAGFQADSNNLKRIKAAWPDMWAKYSHLAEMANLKAGVEL